MKKGTAYIIARLSDDLIDATRLHVTGETYLVLEILLKENGFEGLAFIEVIERRFNGKPIYLLDDGCFYVIIKTEHYSSSATELREVK